MIHLFDSTSVWLATVSGGLSVSVSTQCQNLHYIQSKYEQVTNAVVDTPLCSKKYPAQNAYSNIMPMTTVILAGTGATSTVTLPLTDETSLDSGYEEVSEIRLCEDSYNIVLSSLTL